jgi:glycosyltransferase involved in cell wall biosynthesis
VDSDSSDDTEKLVKEWCNRLGDKCRYYKIRNRFQATKRNFGASIAKGEYLFLLDSDEYMSENLLESCLRHAQEGYESCSIRIEHNWASGYLPVSRYHIRECCTPVETGYPLFIPKATYWKLGGQDEKMNYVEDADFAYKFSLSGGKVFHVTEAFLIHDENVDLRWIVYKPLFAAPREHDLIVRWKGIAQLTPRERLGNYERMLQFLLKQPKFIFGFAFLLATRFLVRRISRAADTGR